MGNEAHLAETTSCTAVDGCLATGRRNSAAASPREERCEGALLAKEAPARRNEAQVLIVVTDMPPSGPEELQYTANLSRAAELANTTHFVTDESKVVFQPIDTFATCEEVVLSVIHYTTRVLKF